MQEVTMTDLSDNEGRDVASLLSERESTVRWRWSNIICEQTSRNSFRIVLKTLAIGQILSLCLCASGVANQALQRQHFNAPMIQSFMYYYLLAVTYGTVFALRYSNQGVATGLFEVLRKRGWKYVVIAVVDVESNYAMVLAYQYTSMTSVQLLDSFAIVGVMVLSWFLLKVHYRLIHYVGIIICIAGTVALVFADIRSSRSSESAPNPVLGDMLVLLGATLISISNVGQEYLVKRFDWIEFVGMIGILGSMISGIQVLIIERTALDNIDWSSHGATILSLMFTFALSSFVLYSITPYFMRIRSALLFVLSLLTADIYSFLCGLFIFDYKFSVLYCVSFAIIATGLVVYNLKPTRTNVNPDSDRSATTAS